MDSNREDEGETSSYLLKIVTTEKVREMFDVVRAEMEKKHGRRLTRGEVLKILLQRFFH